MHPFDDEALLASPSTAPNAALRDRLRERTVGKVRFRRRLRQAQKGALLGLVYLAGAGTLALIRSPEVRIDRQVVRIEVPAVSIAKESPPRRLTAEEEWEADRQLVAVRTADRYRAAGDQYLERGDPKEALRCYKKFLNEATADDLKSAPTDSWLLSTLKRSHSSD